MRHSHAGKRTTAGFTLVELMVVIVIILVLAGLAFGMGKAALTKSRLAASVNVVRDLGVRVHNYANDHAGMLPVYKFDSDNLYWWGVLVNDPKNDAELTVFKSPNDKAFNVKKIESTISYGWNLEVMGKTDSASSDSTDGQKRLASFDEPNRVLVLADGPKGGAMGKLDPVSMPDPDRYSGKAAALLLDGSGRTFEIEELRREKRWFQSIEKLDGN